MVGAVVGAPQVAQMPRIGRRGPQAGTWGQGSTAMKPTRPTSTYCEPTVLWRLRRSATDTARATVVPHWQYATVLWWVNERLEGAVD